MILKEIYYVSFVFSFVIAAIGVYFSIKSWTRLKQIDLITLKARAFLDKSFLYTNFKLALIMIGLVTIHIIMEYLDLAGTFPPELHPVYYAVFPFVILSLSLMIYSWYRLLHK